MTNAATPRPASTVVLLRPAGGRFEVLLLRRHDSMSVMAGAHVFPGGTVDAVDRGPDEAARHRLAAARELREEAAIVLDPDALTPFARWVTPESEPRRFDTWFYAAAAPAGQDAVHDGTEHDDSAWLEPASALEMARRGEITLPPPTWATLRQLAAFSAPGDVLAWARTVEVVPVRPHISVHGGRKVTTVPGTPETRYVLEEGRWLPLDET
jgi:8-oxo-dGTP pyrophosphatase MutT (NUDIX family)